MERTAADVRTPGFRSGSAAAPVRKTMKRFAIFLLFLFCAAPLAAQKPLYIVNGTPCDEIATIDTDDIERIEELPADEESIARYGEKASNGVILITLKYDSPAVFEGGESFANYIARQVKWDGNEPAARVVLRYRVTPEGETLPGEILESTDNRLRRRVLKAVAEAPRWKPATKNGRPAESEGVLRIQLPDGKPLPGEPYLKIW